MNLLSDQFSGFLLIFLTGAAWGVFYDLYHLGWLKRYGQRRGFRPTDLIFWFCSAILIGAGLILGNWMELRLYTWIGLAVGYFVYSVLGRPLVKPLIKILGRLTEYTLAPWVALRGRIGLIRRWRRTVRPNR